MQVSSFLSPTDRDARPREGGGPLSVLILALAAFASLAAAEPASVDPPVAGEAEETSARSGPATSTYRLGAGDVLRVEVFDDPSLSGEFTVTPEGQIVFPLLGPVPAAGSSTTELKNRLTEDLGRDYLYDPNLSVTIAQYRSQKVRVLGNVRQPGVYYLDDSPMSLLEAISRAGGLMQQDGEIRRGQVARVVRYRDDGSEKESIEVDLYTLLVRGDETLNLSLSDGDAVYVQRSLEIHVIGEVVDPGTYSYEEGMTVLKAISLASGPTKKASVRGTRIKRIQDGREVEIKVGVEDEIQPGDIVVVPLSFW